jgi:hypothetical protein
MSGSDEEPLGQGGGRRKDGKPYKEGNIRDDGSYAVGRNRTPPETRFKKGDGRSRGRRKKGVLNDDTVFERELRRKKLVREGDVARLLTKSHAVDVRLIDNATGGDNKAIEMVDQRRRRIAAEKEETARRYHSLSDIEILQQYLRERADDLKIDPGLFGDPDPSDQADPTDG